MASEALHRIDKFSVPAEARSEFLAQVRATHRLLDRQPGLIRNDVTVLAHGDSSFDVVTVVTWESEAAMAAAREAVTAEAAARGFDRGTFMARLGVTGDFGTYVDA